MIEKLKRAGLFVVIFLALSYYIFPNVVTGIFSKFIYDQCDVVYQSKQIEKRKPELRAQSRVYMKKLGVPLEEEHATYVAFGVYKMLAENNCDIPEDIEQKVFKYIGGVEETGTKTCPIGMYYETAEKELSDLKEDKALYEKFEHDVYKLFSENADTPEALGFVKEKWENEEFKRNVLFL